MRSWPRKSTSRCKSLAMMTMSACGYYLSLTLSHSLLLTHSRIRISDPNSYKELVDHHAVQYIAGGAAQNSIRGRFHGWVGGLVMLLILTMMISMLPMIPMISMMTTMTMTTTTTM